MSKSTAMMLQMSNTDGENKQQMIAFPNKAVFRRSLQGTTRTRWRYAAVSDLPTWVANYVRLTEGGTDPMTVTHGPVLMEVTTDEADSADAENLARNVNLRFQRVLDAMDADVPVVNPDIQQWLTDWNDALGSSDDTWIDANIHPAGTAKAPAPEPAPAPAASAPKVEVHGSYPPIKGGYVTRPNGERYKVRKIDGVQDVRILQEAREDRDHVFTFGPPGTGKTALVDSAFGTDFVTMLGTEDTEVPDFIGSYTSRGGGTYGWADGALIEAMDAGVPLYIDEIGVISVRTLTTVFSVMDGRDEIRVTANPDRGIVKAKPGFFVVASTNPDAPGVRLSEALLSRFKIHMEVTTDHAAMREMGVPEPLVTAAENLETRRKTTGVWAPQARELLTAKHLWNKRGDTFAIRNMIASAPADDRDEVVEVLKRATGKTVTMLSL